jgi:co-chaperonin GroES (HSP10)
MIKELNPEITLKGFRVIAKIGDRIHTTKGGLELPESKLNYYASMLVVKVGDKIEDIKVGDEIYLSYYEYQRVQPHTYSVDEGLSLTIDIDAVSFSQGALKPSLDKYKYRMIDYSSIVSVKPQQTN